MLEFWCLSPVRVAYHGSFRENLESAFLGSWTVDPAVLRPLEVAAVLRLGGKGWIIADVDKCQDRGFEMLQFWWLSPVRVVYHGSFRKNLGSAFWGFGVSYRSLIRQMQVFKKSTSGVLQFWCLVDASPQSEWFITVHLERIWSQHFGALECHITTWLSTCKSSKRSSWNVAVLMPLPTQNGLSWPI